MENLSKYAPLVLFCLYAAKLVILGGSLNDAALLAVIGSLSAFSLYKSEDKKIQEVMIRLNEMDNKLQELNKANDDLRSGVASVKIAQNLRQNKF